MRASTFRFAGIAAAMALGGSLATVGGAASASTPGWSLVHMAANGTYSQVPAGTSFTAGGTITLKGLFNGVSTTATCKIAPGTFSVDVPTPAPVAAPGKPFTLTVPLPTNIANFNGTGGAVCTDSATGEYDQLTTTKGTVATVTGIAPPAPASGKGTYVGQLSGSLSVPQNAVQAEPPQSVFPGCELVGPSTAGFALKGTITLPKLTPTSTPKLAVTPGQKLPAKSVNPGDCTVSNVTIQSFSLTNLPKGLGLGYPY